MFFADQLAHCDSEGVPIEAIQPVDVFFADQLAHRRVRARVGRRWRETPSALAEPLFPEPLQQDRAGDRDFHHHLLG